MTETPIPAPTPDPATLFYPTMTGGESVPGGATTGGDTVGGDTVSAPGADSTAADTASGTTAGTEAGGNDTISAPVEGADSLTAESYKFTFPENFAPDDALLGTFRELALEAKLPPAVAQKMVDLLPKAMEAQVAAAQSAYNETQERWRTEITAMPEFATPNATAKSLQSIGKVIDEFGSPAVKEAFNATGAGNNPDVVKFMLGVAKALSEGRPASPARPPAAANGKANSASTWYPNSPELK